MSRWRSYRTDTVLSWLAMAVVLAFVLASLYVAAVENRHQGVCLDRGYPKAHIDWWAGRRFCIRRVDQSDETVEVLDW